jgi:membrane-associated phospholipid phosphatase
MTVCQVAAIVIFLLFPNKQELRPEALPRENIFASLVGLIHSVDTNTNVCPSLHVCYSIALASVWHREAKTELTRMIYKILAVLISISTVMIKQHSVVDIFVALPVCAMAEAVTYYSSFESRFCGE